MSKSHALPIIAALLLGGFDAGNALADSGTEVQESKATGGTTSVVGGTASIIEGTTVGEGVYPWMTALSQNYNKGNGYNQFCGGSLIAARWVLTAAHCVMDNDGDIMKTSVLYASVGTTDLESQNIDYIGATEIIVHPDYDNDAWPATSDLALIKLESAPGNETISIPRWKSTPEAGEKVTVVGWGRIAADIYGGVTELREADMTVRSEDLCHPWYEFDRHLAGDVQGALDYSALVCAGGTVEEATSACFGDSGGPVFVKRQNDEIVLAGVVHGGWECGTAGVPGLYTKVAKFYSWIYSEMTPTTKYKGNSDDVLLAVEVQADWVRLSAYDRVTGNMDHGDVGRYRLAQTKAVTLTSTSGDVDLLVYDSWRMDQEDIICTSDNSRYDEDEDGNLIEDGNVDTCELDSRGTYFARVIGWEESSFSLEND